MRYIHNKKGQAVAEIAIFGSLLLFIFGILLSYMQRFNDQQYVQMEAFRRALQKACILAGGKGASVQLTLIQNRRYTDTSESFRKGSPQTLRASSSALWAIPLGASATVLKVNEDENVIMNGPNNSVKIEDINSDQQTNFNERTTKEESTTDITNQRESDLTDTVTTKFLDENGNPVWEVTQGVYRDTDSQYKYSSSQVGNEIERKRTWKTPF